MFSPIRFGLSTPLPQRRNAANQAVTTGVRFSGQTIEEVKRELSDAIKAGKSFTIGRNASNDVAFAYLTQSSGRVSGRHGRFEPTDDPTVWTFYDTSTCGTCCYRKGNRVGDTIKIADQPDESMEVRLGDLLILGDSPRAVTQIKNSQGTRIDFVTLDDAAESGGS